VTIEFTSGEEHLERYRLYGGDLYMAGIDATEDAWLGNAYFKRGDSPWVMSRTLEGGVHVHDVGLWKGTLYAVGSGSNSEEWFAGDIFAHLWVSQDLASSFEILERHHNDGEGDARWTRLLPLSSGLYIFGYKSNNQGNIHQLPYSVYDKTTVELLPVGHPLLNIFVTETDLAPDGAGIIRGVDMSSEPMTSGIWRFDGVDLQKITQLEESTVVDFYLNESSAEILLLTHLGSEYAAVRSDWHVQIISTTDLENFQVLTEFDTDIAPRSLALWQGGLYYGNTAGQVWRTIGEVRTP